MINHDEADRLQIAWFHFQEEYDPDTLKIMFDTNLVKVLRSIAQYKHLYTHSMI